MQNLGTTISLAINQYVIPIGILAASWKFYFFFEAMLVLQLVTVYFFFIETRGATLEEINKTFDGADAVEEIKHKAVEKEGIHDIREFSVTSKGGDVAHPVTHVDEVSQKGS